MRIAHLFSALALASSASFGAGPALLNVSYDVAREFYKDYNAAFVRHWKKTANEDITVNQSHGGSSKQARSVIDGLEADVLTIKAGGTTAQARELITARR